MRLLSSRAPGRRERQRHAGLCPLTLGAMLGYVSLVRRQHAGIVRARDAAQVLARVDPLTGLGNRRAFDEALRRERDRAMRYGTPLSLILGDIDSFKEVNDRHGHPAGDAVLRRASAQILSSTRSPDECFRWGGDEFAVVLPQTPLDEARRVAARIAAAVTGTVRTPGGGPVVISVGLAQLATGQRPEDLVATADDELLADKRGRSG